MSVAGDTSCLTVAATVRSSDPDGIDIELDPAERCAGCSGFCMWSWGGRRRTARLTSPLPLRVGDRVRVSLPAGQLLSSTLFLHGLPLTALLAGGAIGAFATQSDIGCLVGAVAGLGTTLWAAPRLRARVERLMVQRVIVEPQCPPRRSA